MASTSLAGFALAMNSSGAQGPWQAPLLSPISKGLINSSGALYLTAIEGRKLG